MCSLNLNSVINEQINLSGNQRESIESKRQDLAFNANRETPGLLDELETHRARMPEALREIRKRRVGYHRLYYTGHHTNCYYDTCYLLTFKKSDSKTELDDDKIFQSHLINALADKKIVRVLEDPEEKRLKDKERENKASSWKEKPWYKKLYGKND